MYKIHEDRVNKFRHPVTNARYTRLIFWELQQELPIDKRAIEPLYTLHIDKPGLINFRRMYVELGDPTGYKIANKLLEDYDHWMLLMKAPWFREAKAIWDQELDAKLKSEGMESIRIISNGIEGVSPAVQLQAAKYLANLEHRKGPVAEKGTRGRPTKEEVSGELKKQAEDTKTLEDDMARIGFTLKGNK